MTELSQEENSVHTLLPTQGHTVFIYLSLPRVCLLSLSDVRLPFTFLELLVRVLTVK